MDTFHISDLSETHFEIFSSLTSLFLLQPIPDETFCGKTMSQLVSKTKRFAALYYLTLVPKLRQTKYGPLNFSGDLSLDEFFYSDHWVPLSMYTSVTRFWMENFKFMARFILNDSHLIDSMAETFLTLDPDTGFIQTLDVNFCETRIDNKRYVKINILIL